MSEIAFRVRNPRAYSTVRRASLAARRSVLYPDYFRSARFRNGNKGANGSARAPPAAQVPGERWKSERVGFPAVFRRPSWILNSELLSVSPPRITIAMSLRRIVNL
ncbi:hypothetical protein EVAR_16743_1 [Eumeta japonica]|uniref:Uncharacterized protein n=1 Tax=Eumeta variegata TaxID=151549 RepID=A0A4C1UM69_EUMVA|nr:hypothetical protein EVAR_16743_1 [Eumeta japonica]